jgi:hypothetical protein
MSPVLVLVLVADRAADDVVGAPGRDDFHVLLVDKDRAARLGAGLLVLPGGPVELDVQPLGVVGVIEVTHVNLDCFTHFRHLLKVDPLAGVWGG